MSGSSVLVVLWAQTKKVFEYLYEVSTLPPLVEGQNSINLMQLIGKPYLPTIRRDFLFRSRTRNRQAGFCCLRVKGMPTEKQLLGQDIGEFLIESKKSGSATNEVVATKLILKPSRMINWVEGLLVAAASQKL